MAEPTVGAGYARGLLALAVAKGACATALATAAGIDPADLQDQDARVPFARYVAMMRAAKTMTGDAALGLHYGEDVDIAEVSIIGLIGRASETMLEGFQQLNRYVPLIVETRNADGGDRFRLAPDRGGLWIVDCRQDANDFPELTESAFAQLVCGPRRFGLGPVVKQVHVTHPDPGYREEYERIFQAPVVFGAGRNALEIDVAMPNRKVAILPRYVFGVLSEHAQAMLTALESSKSLRGRVESELMTTLHTGDASMDRIARRLGLSRQTLLRKLKGEGVTYAGVLDGLRRQLALHYLRGRKVSVNETAYLVGFSDPAAFSRAFKRWTGASPRAVRGRTKEDA